MLEVDTAAATAWDDAAAAALRAGCEIRELHAIAELDAAEELLVEVWGSRRQQVGVSNLVALVHAGNYLTGAFDGAGRLVGVCLAFFGAPDERTLHSHIAGVRAEAAGRGVGFAVKLHERAWCLDRQVERMRWTFDPLIARNAHFNLARLGARPLEYLVDFYGSMDDARNSGEPSDRLLVEWDLTAPLGAPVGSEPSGALLGIGPDGGPVLAAPGAPRAGAMLRLGIPDDIEELRGSEPQRALAWRLALRETLLPLLAGQATFEGFERGIGYLFRRSAADAT